ncbi:MAG: diacylglycerol kinase [Gallionella sp.]
MGNQHKNPPGWRHVWSAGGIALQGLREAFRHEDAFRQEVFVTIIAIPVALLCSADVLGKTMLVSSLVWVLIVELINSALEAAVDHTSLAHHPLAKRAKDIASAAVFLSILNAIVIWGAIWRF